MIKKYLVYNIYVTCYVIDCCGLQNEIDHLENKEKKIFLILFHNDIIHPWFRNEIVSQRETAKEKLYNSL